MTLTGNNLPYPYKKATKVLSVPDKPAKALVSIRLAALAQYPFRVDDPSPKKATSLQPIKYWTASISHAELLKGSWFNHFNFYQIAIGRHLTHSQVPTVFQRLGISWHV